MKKMLNATLAISSSVDKNLTEVLGVYLNEMSKNKTLLFEEFISVLLYAEEEFALTCFLPTVLPILPTDVGS